MLHVPNSNLWLGHYGDTNQLQALLAVNDTVAVVDVAANDPIPTLPRDVIYCRFPFVDGSGNSRPLLQLAIATVARLLRTKLPTLIYCDAGVSRSPAIAAAALSLVEGSTPEQWLQSIAELRPLDVTPGLWIEIEREAGELASKSHPENG